MSLLQTLHRGGWLRSVDLGLAKALQRARAETPDLVLVAAALASRALANGHSQLRLGQARELLLEIGSDTEPPELPACADWLPMLRASPWVAVGAASAAVPVAAGAIAAEATATVLVLEGEAVSLRRYWQYEVRLAAAIRARLTASPSAPENAALTTRIAHLFAADAGLGDNAQARAAAAALSGQLLLLTGGPGTGKTSAVARTLVLFAEQFAAAHAGAAPRIALAAPTGKAAARLAEAVRDNLAGLLGAGQVDAALAAALPTGASTLHRLLGWQRGSTQFRHGAAQPLAADLVVVDEASMIDLPLMCKLLEAVPAAATLILIGDRDQLPSVETGDVLAALCDAANAPATALAAHRVHLSHSHRQSAEGEVARLARLIRDGEAEATLAGLQGHGFRGVEWRFGSDRALADAVLAQALPAYRAVQQAGSVPAALAAAKRFRVLAAVREGGAGSQTLNALIAAALDPARRGDGFFPGRLVLINENSYRHQLFNGDIGIAWPDEFGELRVWFDAEGGPRAWLPAALPAHESAFALTVHKSQGSEFEQVFLALPEHGARVLSRELLYTGLTRCRHGVTLWAGAAVLGEGIRRKAQRWSGLAARLQSG